MNQKGYIIVKQRFQNLSNKLNSNKWWFRIDMDLGWN
jgi:hypothetical protein